MATIEKHGEGYRIVVSNGYDQNKKQIRIKSDTWIPGPKMTENQIEKYLKKFAVNFEDEVKSGNVTSRSSLTFKKMADKFIEDMTGELGRTTLPDYKKRLELRIIPAFGHLKISQITNPDVNNYIKMIKEHYTSKDGKNKKLSDSTLKKDKAVISSILSYAVELGYIKINPLIYSGKQGKRKKSKSSEYHVKYFDKDALNAFIWALENKIPIYHDPHSSKDKNGNPIKISEYTQDFKLELKWKLFFYISLFCGSRRGETISLKWSDLNYQNNSIHFDESTDYVNGKMQLTDTKTGNIRDNTVPTYVMNLAKQLRSDHMQRCMILGDAWEGFQGKEFDNNFIFIQDTGRQMHISSPYRQYKRIIRIYNEYATRNNLPPIPADVSMHGLRHSTAALLISNDLDPRSVADLLGHANPSTTLNIYSYFFKDKGQAAADILEKDLLSGTK